MKELNHKVLKEWTNLKLKTEQLKNKKEVRDLKNILLEKRNDNLSKVNLLLTLINLGLFCWLVIED